jgi:hypothetical protein
MVAESNRADNAADSSFLRRSTNTNFSDLDDDELFVLASLASKTLRDHGSTLTNIVTPEDKGPNMFDNAKFEQIACAGLQPKYDGTAAQLIPTLNAIHIRQNNEVWYSATFLIQDSTKLHLIQHFSKAKHDVILQQAAVLWDNPNSVTQRHICGTETYKSRLLALFLMNSITKNWHVFCIAELIPNTVMMDLYYYTQCVTTSIVIILLSSNPSSTKSERQH